MFLWISAVCHVSLSPLVSFRIDDEQFSCEYVASIMHCRVQRNRAVEAAMDY